MKKVFCALLIAPMIMLNSYAIEQEKPLPKGPLQVIVRNRENKKVIQTLEYTVWHKIPLLQDNYSFDNDLNYIDLSEVIGAEELEMVQDYLTDNKFFEKKNSVEKIARLHTAVRTLGLFEYSKKDTHRTTKVIQQDNNLPILREKKETINSNPSLFQLLAESRISHYVFLLVGCAVQATVYSGVLFGAS